MAMAGLKYGLIRPDGTWAAEPAYSIRRELSDGLAAVGTATKWVSSIAPGAW